MDKTPTAHIECKKGDFAKTIIMPGDPKRARYIAKHFLNNAKLVNNVRGMQGYTGTYNGKEVSVMASGMGNPSMGIYSYELFSFYNVDNIIRVGSCGSFNYNLDLKDIVIAKTCITTTNYANLNKLKIFELNATENLVKTAINTAKKLNLNFFCGNIYCTDTFYEDENQKEIMQKYNCLAVEMESASLYYNAKKFNKNALTLCSVSDHILKGTALSAKEREISFNNMIKLALEMA